MKNSLLICSSEFNLPNPQSFEVLSIIEEAEAFFDTVTLIDPLSLFFEIEIRKKPVINFRGQQISDATALIVRNTKECEEATRMLAQALYLNDCELLDPIQRFNGASAGKALMSLKQVKEKTGPDSYVFFNKTSALAYLIQVDEKLWKPLIGKPSHGKQGIDVALLENKARAIEYVEYFFRTHINPNNCLILQQYIDIRNEYRIVSIDGNCLGICEKLPVVGEITRNAAKGSKFISVMNPELEAYVLAKVGSRGIIGVDVAEDHSGNYWILESNRSPNWKAFQEATKVNVAKAIIHTFQARLKVTSEIF